MIKVLSCQIAYSGFPAMLILLFVFPVTTLNAQLSAVEKKIAGYVDKHNPEALRLWEDVVSIER